MVQDTFVKAQGRIDQCRANTRPELRGWLRRILLRIIARVPNRPEVPLDPGSGSGPRAPGPSPGAAAAGHEQDEALHCALRQLRKHYRQVIEWHTFDRLPWAEIGRRTGRSADAARQLWRRAVEHLYPHLESANGHR